MGSNFTLRVCRITILTMVISSWEIFLQISGLLRWHHFPSYFLIVIVDISADEPFSLLYRYVVHIILKIFQTRIVQTAKANQDTINLFLFIKSCKLSVFISNELFHLFLCRITKCIFILREATYHICTIYIVIKTRRKKMVPLNNL